LHFYFHTKINFGGTNPAAFFIYKSTLPNHQIIKSSNNQINKSPNNQITKSPNHQIIKSSNHQITK